MNLRLAHQAEERYDCEASLVYIVSPRTVRTKKKKKKKKGLSIYYQAWPLFFQAVLASRCPLMS